MKVKKIPSSLSFNVIPRKIEVKKGHRLLQLAAVPTGAFFAPKAMLLATLKHGKTKIKYSSELKNFLSNLQLDITLLKPLETYLRNMIRQNRSNPEPLVAILDTYLKNGIASEFSLLIHSSSSSSDT